jgi:D-methionine transport system ATP-binding protein
MPPLISLDRVCLTTASQRPPQLRRKGSLEHPLLQDISLDFAAGEIVGMVGPIGAGKTSLLRLLNRLVDPTQGRLRWQGQDYASVPSLRQQVMLVPQEPKLLGMTVAQAIGYGLELRHCPGPEIQQRSAQWQQRLAIPSNWLDKTEVSLSLGQRQWVTIARALVCESPVLLLDEPTAHLDGNYTARLRQILLEDPARLVVIASHDFDWLATVCQRVLTLQQGRLVQDQPQTDCDWAKLTAQIQAASAAIADEWG